MKRLITANLGWKLLALAIALGLWVTVIGEPELVTSYSAPIFYKNLPRDLEVGSDVPERVHLELRGPAGKLGPDDLSDTAILLDLSGVNDPGERTFTISPGSMNLPAGVSLLRAVPSQLRLRFDRLISKDVPVRVRTTGSQGIRIVSQAVSPPRMRISGPENHVKVVDAAQTDPIDLSKVTSEAQFTVHAYLADPQVRFETSPIITVKIQVERTPQ